MKHTRRTVQKRISVKRKLLLVSLVFAFCTAAQSGKITAGQAKDHIGEVQTVCGKVANTHFAARSKGQPTFLNLDEPYPKEIFTILIWGSDRAKFGTPETKYQNASICVTGKITSHRGSAEIVATEPTQIVIPK
jgi:hypothetical protein